MKRVIGGLFGLVALAAYVAGASELSVALLGQEWRGDWAPEAVLYWLDQTPIVWGADPEAWRLPVVGAALGAGAVGGLFLVFGARIAAVFLWLAFLLLAGLYGGHDLYLKNAFQTEPSLTLILGAGVITLSFLLALIGQAVTGDDEDEAVSATEPGAFAAPEPAAARASEPAPAPAAAPATAAAVPADLDAETEEAGGDVEGTSDQVESEEDDDLDEHDVEDDIEEEDASGDSEYEDELDEEEGDELLDEVEADEDESEVERN